MSLFHAVPSLQSLIISRPETKPSTLQLATTLQSMPNLRTLKLVNALPPLESPYHYPTSITFHHLVDLYMDGSESECISFLNSTSFLMTLSLEIEINTPIEDNTYSIFQPWISNVWRVQGCEFPGIKRVSVSVGRYLLTEASVSAYPRVNDLNPDAEIDLSWASAQPPAQEGFVRWAISSFPLSRCTELEHRNFLTREE
ncbi:hypothetical protein AX16_005833 [Volvariella volvacea WC 439]|nr:hypothetical protein AX16_005833 [Volvariella volvacea WC 439]